MCETPSRYQQIPEKSENYPTEQSCKQTREHMHMHTASLTAPRWYHRGRRSSTIDLTLLHAPPCVSGAPWNDECRAEVATKTFFRLFLNVAPPTFATCPKLNPQNSVPRSPSSRRALSTSWRRDAAARGRSAGQRMTARLARGRGSTN